MKLDSDGMTGQHVLVDADLHSTFSHGLKNLRNYITQVTSGKINPKAQVHDVDQRRGQRRVQRGGHLAAPGHPGAVPGQARAGVAATAR